MSQHTRPIEPPDPRRTGILLLAVLAALAGALGPAATGVQADPVDRYDYVIIVGSNDLTNAVEPLRQWKEELGYSVWVVTTAEIEYQYQSGDLATDIWTYLHERYSPDDWGIRYVLLIGDVDAIPMRILYPDGDIGDGLGYGSDYYYCLPSHTQWDQDGDRRWGEFGHDDLPTEGDILVGRVPLNNPLDVTDYVTDLIAYEQDTGGWKRSVLMAAGILDYPTRPSEAKTDAAVTTDLIDRDILSPNGWNVKTLHERGGIDPSGIASNDTLDRRHYEDECGPALHGVINSLAHGNQSSMASWQWTDDLDSDGYWDPGPPAPEINGNMFSLDWSIPTFPPESFLFLCGCSTGRMLGDDPGFAASGLRSEYLVTTPVTNSMLKQYLREGAPAVIAATVGTEYSNGWDRTSDGSEQSVDYFVLDELLANDRNGGDAFYEGMTTYAESPGLGLVRGVRGFNYFGDPSVHVKGFDSRPGGPDVQIHEGFYYSYGVDYDDNGDLYVAALTTPLDQAGLINVYRSTDHGQTWALWTTVPHESPVTTVDLLVGRWQYEALDERILVFFGDDYGDVWVERVGLIDPDQRDRQPIHAEQTGMRIDDLEATREPGALPRAFHAYVTWEASSESGSHVWTAHTPNNGVYWLSRTDFDGYRMPDIEATVDGAVYLSATARTNPDRIEVFRSTTQGATWSAGTDLTDGDGAGPTDVHYHSTIGASTDPNTPGIWVAYELVKSAAGDDPETREIRYAYSTDSGGSWERNRILTAASGSKETMPDLASYRSSPNAWINVVHNHLGPAGNAGKWQVRWRYANAYTPPSWSAQRICNDHSATAFEARAVYSPGAPISGSGAVYGGASRENLYFAAPWLAGNRPFPDLIAGRGTGAARPPRDVALQGSERMVREIGDPRIWLPLGDLPGLSYASDIASDEDALYACGADPTGVGRVYRSFDEGITWEETGELEGAVSLSFVERLGNGDLWSGGFARIEEEPAGALYRFDEESGGWDRMLAIPGAVATCFLEGPFGNLYAGTGWDGDVYRSDDDGQTWNWIGSLGNGAIVQDLLISSAGSLVAACEGEAVAAIQVSEDGSFWVPADGLAGVTSAYDLQI
ncbi:MAG: hypothetical protein GF346_12320, partial [Candidatus Eisenbacteria bacterium]|nr:hypothetical protein [Candidatus Latescibacterota bacterium]MBD3303221.1 hypothetical protein [Candidatus Eisenbacteria bacterium]